MNKRQNMEEDTIEELTLQLNKCLINGMKNGAIGYTRVANKGREKELEAQKIAIQEYCTKNNIMLKEIISDVGSAYHNNSKLSIYDIIENNDNIILLVTKPSILSRNIVSGVTILDMCIKKNIIIHIIENNYTCNTSENNKRFICDTYDMMMESKEMSIKQKTNNKIRKVSYHVPFGMMKTADNIIIELPREHIEQHTIDIIDMMYYGCNMNDFYKLFNSSHDSLDILGSKETPFCDYKKKVYTDADFKKGFTVGTIVGLLNDWNILNRDKKWTSSAINMIVDTYLEPGEHNMNVEMVV